MNCADAKHLIHLDVGNDLRVEEESQLATHMEQCGECRSYHGQMSIAMSALATLRDEPSIVGGSASANSIWPALSREIKRRTMSPRVVRKFNLQVVALSVCSLSLAVVTMVQSLSSMRSDDSFTGYMPARSVSELKSGFRPQDLSLQYNSHFSSGGDELVPMMPNDFPVSMPQSF